MKFVVRTDSSSLIGSGHVQRCLTLAQKLRETGHHVVFICRELPGNLIQDVRAAGLKVLTLPFRNQEMVPESEQWLGATSQQDALQTLHLLEKERLCPDWLIVDHYSLDKKWERKLQERAERLFVIDDLANRPHDCHILLDQNVFDNPLSRYTTLVPEHCSCLLGPRYALLRDEFMAARNFATIPRTSLKHLLIFMGGVDATHQTLKALAAVDLLKNRPFKTTVVTGRNYDKSAEVRAQCARLGSTSYFCGTSTMAQLMATADLAIGAGGVASLERAFTGLGSIVVSVAQNQRTVCQNMSRIGAAIDLGWFESVTLEQIADTLGDLVDNSSKVQHLSAAAANLFDMKSQPGIDEVVNVLTGVESHDFAS